MRLNSDYVTNTKKQLTRLNFAYIVTLVIGGMLLIPFLNLVLGRMLFTSLLFGSVLYLKKEMNKHYKTPFLTAALWLSGLSFGMNILQEKCLMALASQSEIQVYVMLLIGFIIYGCIATAFFFIVQTALDYRAEYRHFQEMLRGVPSQYHFKLQPSKVDQYDNVASSRSKKDVFSFSIRAALVIFIYFIVMNNDVAMSVFVLPIRPLLGVMKEAMQDGHVFEHLARVWINVYIQTVFVVTFGALFYREIRQAVKRFKTSACFLIVLGYGISIVSAVLVQLLLVGLGVHIPQSENQNVIIALQKIAPIPLAISAVLLAPITEELVFRQGIAELIHRLFYYFPHQKKWTQDAIVVMAIMVSGILFGLIHVLSNGDFIAMIPYVVSGIVYTSFYFLSGRNVAVTIGIHMLNNAIATFITL